MRIDAFTTAVGERYVSYLINALPFWIDAVDQLTVIGMCDDLALQSLERIYNARVNVKRSEAFLIRGSRFNKAAALNDGISRAGRLADWVLVFDCDIIPPIDVRQRIESAAVPGALNGSRRTDVGGEKFLDAGDFFVRGYFQLWHASDVRTDAGHPRFDESSKHAGKYDTLFGRRWPKKNHHDLLLGLTHQGQKSRYWFGPETTEADMRRALAEAALRGGGFHQSE